MISDVAARIKAVRKQFKLSQSAFGEPFGANRDQINNVENGRAAVYDMMISAICRTYGVNEIWLRTGAGEPFTPTSRKEEMTSLFAQLLRDRTESFRVRAITTLLKFDADGPEWAVLEKIYNSIAQEAEALKKQKPPDR